MSTSATSPARERGDLFGARFELFADVLSIGLATAVASLPLITLPAALSTACTLLRRRRLYAEPCTAGRYFGLLRTRMARRGEWAAGALVFVFGAVLAADAGLAAAGLPGAVPFALALAAVATGACVAGLRTCALYGHVRAEPGRGGRHEGWRHAARAGAARTVRDLPGTALVVLALGTAVVCAWALPPVAFLVPGPLAAALTAVELRWEHGR